MWSVPTHIGLAPAWGRTLASSAARSGWHGFGGPPRGSFSYRRGGGTKSVTGPAAPGASRRLRLRRPTRRPHQEHGLLRRNQPLRPVRPERRAGLLQLERTEEVLAEVAIVATRRLWLARHRGDIGTDVTLS